VSIPQHEYWEELFEDTQRDPLPLWTRFGAAFLPDTLFPRDYHTNPILVYFGRRRAWRDAIAPAFVLLFLYPFAYPACAFLAPMPTLWLVLLPLLGVFVLPVIAAAHTHRFLARRLAHVPFQDLALTRLTAAEIVQGLALQPLADVRTSVIAGIASLVISIGWAMSFYPPETALPMVLAFVILGLLFLFVHARVTLYAGVVAAHVALTRRDWTDTLRRVSGHIWFLLGGFVAIFALTYLCGCLALIGVVVFAILLRDRTRDIAEELWSNPDEWWVYRDEA